MYDQLRILEKMVLDIKKQHQLVSAELSNLKNQPVSDPKEISVIKTKLDNSFAERDAAKKQLNDLDKRYQSLAEAHHMIGEEQDKLHKQIEQLQHQNHALQQHNTELKQQYSEIKQQNIELKHKNELAAEHTQVVLKRLRLIDQAEG